MRQEGVVDESFNCGCSMTTRDYGDIYSIPRVPGIYAFHVGGGRVQSISYVGSTGNLRTRVSQHMEYRDSSVTSGLRLR